MSGFTAPIGGPGSGLFIAPIIITVKANEALTQNNVVQIDLVNATLGATSTQPGYLARQPDQTAAPVLEQQCGIYGIALETIASGSEGKVMIQGIATANVDGACVKHAGLLPATDGQLDVATGGTGLKIVALGLEADTSNVARVWISGIHGFGMDVASNVSS